MKEVVEKAISKKDVKQKINLVDGMFTVAEADHVVQSLLDEKINFHKLQRLSMNIGSLCANTKYPDERITELEHEKSVAKEFFKQARTKGMVIKMNGTLEISFADKNDCN